MLLLGDDGKVCLLTVVTTVEEHLTEQVLKLLFHYSVWWIFHDGNYLQVMLICEESNLLS